MKPIIVICGAPHSLTSMIAAFLIENGGYAGECKQNESDLTSYAVNENMEISEFVKARTKFKKRKLDLSNFPEDRTIILKAPVSAFFLNEIESDRTLKVVYAIRRAHDVIVSKSKKSKSKFYSNFAYSYNRWNKIYGECAEYEGELLPLMAERILNKNEHDLKRLLDYCELPTDNIQTNSIESRNPYKTGYINFRRVNFLMKLFGRYI